MRRALPPRWPTLLFYSDYPEAAHALPRVGNNRLLDLERIVSLKPDLVVVWRHGNADRQTAQLEAFGIPLCFSEHQTAFGGGFEGSPVATDRH